LERATIAEAAKLLNVTQEAIRGRIKRGTIEHEKGDDGKTYVFLTDAESHAQHDPNGMANGMVNDYIEALKSEIADWKEEARRKDTIIAQMNQTMGALIHRIPELEAPSEPAEARVTDETAGGKGSSVPPERENGSERRSWWRRILQ
jgi:hypothetical protein